MPIDSLDTQPGQAAEELRTVTDARTLRALAHPVRIALIESLSLEGPKTATEVGEMIGESATTCSFHLRQLAKYGFVEEAGGGKGRARPWRMTSIGMRLTSTGEDPEAEVAANSLMHMLRDRQLGRYRTWLNTRSSYPKAWRDATQNDEYVVYVTAEELESLSKELSNLLFPRFRERLTDSSKRPPGALPVEVLVFSYPIRQPVDET